MDDAATKITQGRPHVVLLGAGASLAAFPDGVAYGRQLPVMSNFIETVEGLSEYLADHKIKHDGNIENLYSSIVDDPDLSSHAKTIETIIYSYFSSLVMPKTPTLYDYLVLSLRKKDMIATFNWDPFLYQAFYRVSQIVGLDFLPRLSFLHGNVATGFCQSSDHERMMVGGIHQTCSCGNDLEPCSLLYPVRQKNYTDDPFISAGWHDTQVCLENAYMFTIFGYGAPESDVEAVSLLQDGWGEGNKRNLEQVEIIDIVEHDALVERWERFLCKDHLFTPGSFERSYMVSHPRRSCDAFWDAAMQCAPRSETPIDLGASWDELREWVAPYIEVEKEL